MSVSALDEADRQRLLAALLRLEDLPVDLFGDHLGPADLELVAFPAHRLDEHGQLQLAAAGDLDDVG